MPLQDSNVQEITSRLDVMIKLMAALFAREFSNIDAIVKLDTMQLSREQIADALGITTQNVRQQLYLNSKKAEKKGKQTKAEQPESLPPATEEVQQ